MKGFTLLQWFVNLTFSKHFRPSKKTHMFLVRISIKRRAGGRFVLFFIISYYMLSLHIITCPQGYVGALRSNINKTKHRILIWCTQRVNSKNLHYFGVHSSNGLYKWRLLVFAHKNVAHKNNKKREAALKNEAGGDERRVFFSLGLISVPCNAPINVKPAGGRRGIGRDFDVFPKPAVKFPTPQAKVWGEI